MTLNINGITDSTHTLTVSTTPATITAISPKYASPVLKEQLTLTVSGFAGTLSTTDLSVSIVSQSNSSYVKYINVVAVGTNTITVKFGGAPSGIYNVFVTSASYGKFSTSGITLQTIGVVTSYSP